MKSTFNHFIQELSASCAYLEYDRFERSLSVCSLEMVLAEIKEKLCTEIKDDAKAESTFKEFQENLIKTIKYILDNRSIISEIKSSDHNRFQKEKTKLTYTIQIKHENNDDWDLYIYTKTRLFRFKATGPNKIIKTALVFSREGWQLKADLVIKAKYGCNIKWISRKKIEETPVDLNKVLLYIKNDGYAVVFADNQRERQEILLNQIQHADLCRKIGLYRYQAIDVREQIFNMMATAGAHAGYQRNWDNIVTLNTIKTECRLSAEAGKNHKNVVINRFVSMYAGKNNILKINLTAPLGLGNMIDLKEKYIQNFSFNQAIFFCLSPWPGLMETHRAKIIHQDIKNGNLLFFKYGELYETGICDFGIACTMNSSVYEFATATPGRLAPEAYSAYVAHKNLPQFKENKEFNRAYQTLIEDKRSTEKITGCPMDQVVPDICPHPANDVWQMFCEIDNVLIKFNATRREKLSTLQREIIESLQKFMAENVKAPRQLRATAEQVIKKIFDLLKISGSEGELVTDLMIKRYSNDRTTQKKLPILRNHFSLFKTPQDDIDKQKQENLKSLIQELEIGLVTGNFSNIPKLSQHAETLFGQSAPKELIEVFSHLQSSVFSH